MPGDGGAFLTNQGQEHPLSAGFCAHPNRGGPRLVLCLLRSHPLKVAIVEVAVRRDRLFIVRYVGVVTIPPPYRIELGAWQRELRPPAQQVRFVVEAVLVAYRDPCQVVETLALVLEEILVPQQMRGDAGKASAFIVGLDAVAVQDLSEETSDSSLQMLELDVLLGSPELTQRHPLVLTLFFFEKRRVWCAHNRSTPLQHLQRHFVDVENELRSRSPVVVAVVEDR